MSEESSFVAPAGLLERVRNINQIYKQTVKLLPIQQGNVVNGNKITVQFPVDSVFDLRSLSFDAFIQTSHAGNQSGNAANNYVQTYYLPRNGIASMISQLDIRINGRSIQNISQYSYVYNAISDWVYNGSNMQDEVGAVADPSLMTFYNKGKLHTRRGYPVSFYGDGTLTDIVNKSCRLYDKYSCRRFLGFLGESSTFIINTALLGDLTIEFTLEGTNVLMAGCTVPDTWPIIPSNTAATLYTTAATSNVINSMDPINDIAADNVAAADTAGTGNALNTKLIDLQNYMKLTRGFTIGDTGAGSVGNCTTGTVGSNYQQAAIPNAGAIAAETPSFTFSNINFTITRYEFGDSSYYDALNRALDSGHQFQVYFKNYQVFNGTSTNDKNQSMRITIASQSLNYLIGTFQAPNRTTITQPINTLISPPQAGENGVYSATFDNQVDSGMPRTFNNALYFVRNGSKIKTSKWSVDQQDFPVKDIYDIYNENLRHWGKFGKPENIYKGIQTIYHFQETFFTDVLSLEIPDQYNDGLYNVSGVNCKGVPLNIIYNTVGGDDTSFYQYTDVSAVANITAANKKGFSAYNLYLDTNSTYTPVIIANFTSKLVLSKGRNVEYYN
jgi:hypothetical protein